MNIGKFNKTSVTKIINEAFRTKSHKHGCIDETKTKYNHVFIDNVPRNNEGKTSSNLICEKIKSLGVTRKIQANANLMVTSIINLPMNASDWNHDFQLMYFDMAIDAWCKTMGITEDKVLYAVAHFDETSPHLQIGALPVFEYTSKPNKKTGKVKKSAKLSCDFIDKKFLYNFHPEMQRNLTDIFKSNNIDFEPQLYDKELIDARHQAQNRGDHSLDYVPLKQLKKQTEDKRRELRGLEDEISVRKQEMKDLPTDEEIRVKKSKYEALNDDYIKLDWKVRQLKREKDDLSYGNKLKNEVNIQMEQKRKAKEEAESLLIP